jgi:membrane protease subunit HflK
MRPNAPVVTRFGRYVATAMPGIRVHIPWPIEARQIVNVESVEGFSDETRMLTSDENLVDIKFTVQYRRAEPVRYAFSVRDPEDTLGEVSESAIREIVGAAGSTSCLAAAGDRKSPRARRNWCSARSRRTRPASRSPPSTSRTSAFPSRCRRRSATRSRPARTRSGSGSRRRRTPTTSCPRRAARHAPDRGCAGVPDAHRRRRRGRGARFSSLLDAYERAPGVTRQRLYYETIEEVLGNTNKVLVDTKAGGNVLYLPLDKLTERRTPTLTLDEQRQSATAPGNSPRETQEIPSTTVDARRERGTR